MPIDIRPSNPRDISWIGANLQDSDRAEILCQVAPDTMGSTAALICHFSAPEDMRWIAYYRDLPICAFGCTPVTYAEWRAWAFGTSRMWRALPALARFGWSHVYPALVAKGATCLEARALAGNRRAFLLLQSLGASFRTELPDRGRNGETFQLWDWTKTSVLRSPSAQTAAAGHAANTQDGR